jgi:hypothetical protein
MDVLFEHFIVSSAPIGPEHLEAHVIECKRIAKALNMRYGGILDLTNTPKTYTTEMLDVLASHRICRRHVPVPGLAAPDMRIACAVMQHLRDAVRSNSLITVHCTHGVHRTGALLVKFMTLRSPFNTVKHAQLFLSEFESVRGNLELRPLQRQWALDTTSNGELELLVDARETTFSYV